MGKGVDKREFLKIGLIGVSYFCCRPLMAHSKFVKNIINSTAMDENKPWKWSKEVFYYEQKDTHIVCQVCPHECSIRPNERGFCKTKVNYNDKLYSIAYGNPCSVNIDPIEKKPLLHFKPQTQTFSLATAGCNFRCLNCQNWSISQISPIESRNYDLMPDEVIIRSKRNNCQSISFTYSEPVVFYEYMFDIAKLAKENRLDSVLVSNGYINEKPLRDLAPYLSAANIDLKTFDTRKHLELTKGHISKVLNTIKVLNELNIWVEIANLVIPQWTDDMETIKRMCDWLADNNLSHLPLHFTRFSPMHQLAHLPVTPVSVLENAHKIAKEAGIKYAYIGNVPGHELENTFCPSCKKMIVERRGYHIINNRITNGKCSFCNTNIHGVWN
ncbi:MAG: AmmeMemoRadiSam system radical SAM enzyme [Bacteroidales bacterium]|nr:AmmeMemoRadiSam system radical SAM enzyme [Bacteroidales bacterium]